MEKTSEEWQEECKEFLLIIDPDGWDRSNLQRSWYEEKITKTEFFIRVVPSTIKANIGKIIEWENKSHD